jgi:hypothetical protein
MATIDAAILAMPPAGRKVQQRLLGDVCLPAHAPYVRLSPGQPFHSGTSDTPTLPALSGRHTGAR